MAFRAVFLGTEDWHQSDLDMLAAGSADHISIRAAEREVLAQSSPSQILDLPSGDITTILIEDALSPVSDDLEELGRRITTYLVTESRDAKDVIDHIFKSGGKKIRPALFFMCARLLGYRGDHLYPIASVSEYVHTASLLHDDVVDNSNVRRNKPTAKSIWGDETSVLVGDLIYSTASELMAATGNMEIVKTFARAIRLMSDGELLQLENLFNGSISEDVYLRIVECKTAVLVEASCRSAGLLAGASEAQCQALSRFGRNVGMAFQMIDDALDYTGASEIVGKKTLVDLADGKVTLPVIMLRELSSEEDRTILENIVSVKGTWSRDHVLEVARLVEKYDTAELTVNRAHRYTSEAMRALHEFSEGPQRDALENLANKLLYRFN